MGSELCYFKRIKLYISWYFETMFSYFLIIFKPDTLLPKSKEPYKILTDAKFHFPQKIYF